MATTPDVLLLAFRGSESVGDWLADLNIRSVTRDYGHVHRGFAGAFADAKDAIVADLLQRPRRPLAVTGHSLGGALATLAAVELNWQFGISSVYTFGQPRVGKDDFERNFEDLALNFQRIVNDDDIVARVPPGYVHVGNLTQLGPAESVAAVSESPAAAAAIEAPPLTDAQFDALRSELLAERARRREAGMSIDETLTPAMEGVFPSFRDHKIDNYIRQLSRHVQ